MSDGAPNRAGAEDGDEGHGDILWGPGHRAISLSR
jgi:hypothetical protein